MTLHVIFPRFAPATCICLVFLLVLCVVYVCCDWLITSVWILWRSWARLWKPPYWKSSIYLPYPVWNPIFRLFFTNFILLSGRCLPVKQQWRWDGAISESNSENSRLIPRCKDMINLPGAIYVGNRRKTREIKDLRCSWRFNRLCGVALQMLSSIRKLSKILLFLFFAATRRLSETSFVLLRLST